MKTIILTLTALLALSLSAFAAAPKDANNPWFKKHDTNGDGVITKSEFIAARSAFYVQKKKISKEEADQWAEKSFAKADKNKDGKLTAEEFFTAKK
jgi:Ca2+-binding EF-hand superfamily protein